MKVDADDINDETLGDDSKEDEELDDETNKGERIVDAEE
jgi:hypothetical protein